MDRIKTIINLIYNLFKKTSSVSAQQEGSFFCDNNYLNFIYKKPPVNIYIENNIDILLNNCIKYFNNKKIYPKIGIEIEFFTKDENIDYDNIFNFCKINNIDIHNIEKERGKNQLEIQFNPYIDINKLIFDYNILKKYLIEELECNFNCFVNNNDVGNALQVNISLIDNLDNNLFFINNNYFLNCIAGLLSSINMFINFYSNDIYRYNKINNSKLYSKGLIPAPSYISWGYNNRTCAIRIPTTKITINDKEKYNEELKNNRRIEFRVPSSNSDIKFVLYCVLNSIIYGIENNLQPIADTYNNTFIHNENLEEITNKQYFNFEKYYDYLKVINNYSL